MNLIGVLAIQETVDWIWRLENTYLFWIQMTGTMPMIPWRDSIRTQLKTRWLYVEVQLLASAHRVQLGHFSIMVENLSSEMSLSILMIFNVFFVLLGIYIKDSF